MFLNFQPACLGHGNLSFDQRFQLAKDYGFGGLDIPLDDLTSDADAIARRDKLKAAHLHPGLFWMPCDISSADDVSFEKSMIRLQTLAPLAHKVGLHATYCHIWSGHEQRPFAVNWEWHLARIRRVIHILRPHNIRFGLEFLGPWHFWAASKHPFIHTLDQCLEMIHELGDGAGLVFDTFHWYCSGGTLEGLKEKLASVPIVNVHVNDATPGRTPQQQLDDERLLPLESGLIDVRGILAVLKQIHYEGAITVEPFKPWTDRFKQMSPDQAAAKVAQVMKPLL